MIEITAQSQQAKITGFTNGYKATYLLDIGAELGILQLLNNSKEGLTAAEIALKLDLYEPYLKVWCQTAYHFEILDCDDQGRFKFQPFLDEILGDESKPGNMLGNLDLVVNVSGERLRNSVEYYRTGKTMDDYSPERSRIVGRVTHAVHQALVNIISSMPENDSMKQSLDGGCKFLDIGCGSGGFITQLAQAFPGSTFTGVDPVSHSIELAAKRIS